MPDIKSWSAAAAALIASAPAYAQDTKPVEEVVVTATRAAEGIEADKTGGSLTVIGPQAMEDRQVRAVADVLRDIPSVAVSRAGSFGALTQVRVRGSEGNHVLTLIDGIEAADPFFGEFDYATLLADEVSRVEVLRGQQSALYGSDAIGGVIHYITPTGAEAPGTRLRLEAGSMDTYGGSGRVAGVDGGFDYVLSAGYQHTGGYPVATVGTRDIGSRLGSAAAKVSYVVNDQLKLRAVVRHSETDVDVNDQDFGTTGFVLDAPGSGIETNSTYAYVGAEFSLLDGRWTGSLSAQGVDAERDVTTSSVRTGGDKGTRRKASLTSTWHAQSGTFVHALTGAVDLERETYRNTAPVTPFGPDITKRSVETVGLVAEYNLAVGDAGGFRAAVRRDENEFFRDATTYRVEAYWNATDVLRLRAAAGSGVKAPSQTELFGFNAGAFPFVGNPRLKPERSEGWEAGADANLAEGRVRLSATYFDSTLHDEIISVFGAPIALCSVPGRPAPFSCSTTENAATKSTQQGVELWGQAGLGEAFTLDASYSWLDAKQNGARELRRPPRTLASANLTWRPEERASATLTVRYNGPMLDTEFATFSTVRLKAFTLVNLAGSFDLTDRIELFGRVENLTDEDYYEVFAFRTPGRAAYAGVRARF
jgi:vitamin B12 transporter